MLGALQAFQILRVELLNATGNLKLLKGLHSGRFYPASRCCSSIIPYFGGFQLCQFAYNDVQNVLVLRLYIPRVNIVGFPPKDRKVNHP